jgi:heme oxygenase (biliverdin-IX-beta and delta-forming)
LREIPLKAADPVSQSAVRAIEHLNDDHADALLEMAQALGRTPEATAARCVDADRTGLDLVATTAAGEVEVRSSTTSRSTSPRACASRGL